MSHFDEKAASWDDKPHRVAMGRAIACAVAFHLDSARRPRLMDYGCGTGLCSLSLAERCAIVWGVDSSTGMLAQFEAKARAAGFDHVFARQHDLTVTPLNDLEPDVILCAMTLHHVRDVEILLKRFYEMLSPGGLVAIADLDQEDGSFHQDTRGVYHHGFRRKWMREQLCAAGFARVNFETVYEIEKTTATGTLRRFPVFLATARAPR